MHSIWWHCHRLRIYIRTGCLSIKPTLINTAGTKTGPFEIDFRRILERILIWDFVKFSILSGYLGSILLEQAFSIFNNRFRQSKSFNAYFTTNRDLKVKIDQAIWKIGDKIDFYSLTVMQLLTIFGLKPWCPIYRKIFDQIFQNVTPLLRADMFWGIIDLEKSCFYQLSLNWPNTISNK